MAISVDWGTKIITVSKADMIQIQTVPFEIRELDLDAFRLELKSLEDSDEGMTFPDTHRHNTVVTLAGVTLARVVEIINGYTVTFEDGQYAVNAVNANSNLADVINLNQVSLRTFNSAGLQVVSVGSGLSLEEHNRLMATAIEDGGRIEAVEDGVGDISAEILGLASDLSFIKKVEGGKWEIDGDQMIFYDEDNMTEIMRFDITRDVNNNPIMRVRVP